MHQEAGQGPAMEPAYRSHRRQAHLPLSPGAPGPPLLAHFGQQHAEVCGENCTLMCSERIDTHLAVNKHLAKSWRPRDTNLSFPQLSVSEDRRENSTSTESTALVISSSFLTSSNPLYLLRLHIQRVNQINYILFLNYIHKISCVFEVTSFPLPFPSSRPLLYILLYFLPNLQSLSFFSFIALPCLHVYTSKLLCTTCWAGMLLASIVWS